MDKNSFSRDEVDEIIRRALQDSANRPSTSQHQHQARQTLQRQPQQLRSQRQRQQQQQRSQPPPVLPHRPQQSNERPSYWTPPARGETESRIESYVNRLTRIPDFDFGAYFHVLGLILEETKNDISYLVLIDKTLDDIENDYGRKGFAPLDFKPCRWFNVGSCHTRSPTHLEDDSNPNSNIRTHICCICHAILRRAHHHPGYQCKLLDFLDKNEVPKELIDAGANSDASPDGAQAAPVQKMPKMQE